MFNSLINNIKKKIDTKKKENEEYNNILNNSIKFTDFTQIKTFYNEYIDKNLNLIINTSPDINKEKATIISKLIPLNETYLSVIYSKEVLTNTEYYLIPTNKYLWIITTTTYKIINYSDITICNIIKNNLMSKIINFNNIVLEITGSNEQINDFINILTNTNYRNQVISNKTNYLCGITPIYQKVNNINTGISIDNNKNIVFHTKEFNYLYNYKDITNYEILVDNNVIISKQTNTGITSMQNTCYTISIRITTKDKQFTLPILEQNSLGTKYSYHDTIYQSNINFSKIIFNKLNEICKDNYY